MKLTQLAKQRMIDMFNQNNPVGTEVRYWRGAKEGEPSGQGKTSSDAFICNSGYPVIFIKGCSGYICLTHVEVVEPQPDNAICEGRR